MKKWEYWVCDLRRAASDEQAVINRLGELGWELISVVALPLCRRAYFKCYPDTKTENSANNAKSSASQKNDIEDTCEFPAIKKPSQEPLNFGEY
jgi:G:T-mismatch repair DNA endonuclease (very short patch repair protein)